MPNEQTCRVCGCTENNACYDPENDDGCHWVEPDLCSVCARQRQGNAAQAHFKEWAIVELMGHRRLAGLLSEQEIAGHGFLRLDIPGKDGAIESTQFYSPAAVYALTPTTEAVARSVATLSRPDPVARWELPQLPAETPEDNPL